jgi:conjugal transfer pilus assembly protein TraE
VKFSFNQKHLGQLYIQRNFCIGLVVGLLGISILQTVLLFFKNDKTIILPPELKQSFWVEGNKFSPSYLEEQGIYFAHLLLDVNQSNILSQGEILLRYVDPKFYADFRSKILNSQKRLQKDNLNCLFTIVETKVYANSLSLELTGDLQGFVGNKKVTNNRETYLLEFSQIQARLFLKNFKVIKTDQQNPDFKVDDMEGKGV